MNTLPPDYLDQLSTLVPSKEEKERILRDRKEHPDRELSPHMRLFVNFISIKDMEEKLEILKFRQRLEQEQQSRTILDQNITAVMTAEQAIRESEQLPKLLSLIRVLHNERTHSTLTHITWTKVLSQPPPTVRQQRLLCRIIRHEFPHVSRVFRMIPILEKAANVTLSYEKSLAAMESLNEAADSAEKALIRIERPLISHYDICVNLIEEIKKWTSTQSKNMQALRNQLANMLVEMGEPIPQSTEEMEPERFFRKLADYLKDLKEHIHLL